MLISSPGSDASAYRPEPVERSGTYRPRPVAGYLGSVANGVPFPRRCEYLLTAGNRLHIPPIGMHNHTDIGILVRCNHRIDLQET